jgi:hypothetical protein
MKFRLWRKKASASSSLGSILVDWGVVTREELLKAVETKLHSSGEQLLGEVLIARGSVTRTQLDRAMAEQRKRRGGDSSMELAAVTRNLIARSTANYEDLHGKMDEVEAAAREASGEEKH